MIEVIKQLPKEEGGRERGRKREGREGREGGREGGRKEEGGKGRERKERGRKREGKGGRERREGAVSMIQINDHKVFLLPQYFYIQNNNNTCNCNLLLN